MRTHIALAVAALVLLGAAVFGGVTLFGGSSPAPAGAAAPMSSAPMMPSASHSAKAKATAPASSMMPSSSMPAASMMPSSSPSVMTAQCDSSNTSVTLGTGNGAAGTLYETLVIRNTSTAPCVTGGYPGISLDTSMGSQLGPAAGRMGSSGSEVTLQPGAEATDVFSYGDAAVSTEMGCNPEQGADIRVYLPNAMGSATVPFSQTGCSGDVNYLNVWAVNVMPGS
jgi:hypothetical protein